MLELLTDPSAWIALATLTALEIVLGIDNIIFISILASRLPREQQPRARTIGLGVALVTRILLLLSIAWVMSLVEPLFSLREHEVSGRDMILLAGGLFLLGKSTLEIHHSIEGGGRPHDNAKVGTSFAGVIVQIGLLDIVFSLDSVITAVGLADDVRIMIAAICLAMVVMLVSARAIGEFVEAHPTVKILALSFLILVGVLLIADGFHQHIPKGYVYFAMAFAFGVEMLNLRMRARIDGPRPGAGPDSGADERGPAQ